VSWVAELSGIWSFGFSIIGKNNEDLDGKFLRIYNQFKEDIIDHRFKIHRRSSFFYEKYLGVRIKKSEKKSVHKISKKELDEKDKTILKELSENSRLDSVALARAIKLTAPAVVKRMRKLEEEGYIQKYSIFMDVSKLALYQYSIFIINKNIDNKKMLISYLSEHERVSFIAEYVGDEFLEFGFFVSNPYDLREKLQKIEEDFPDNRIIEVSLFQKEFVSVGPPRCVFE
jgi:DNA-binding Lrp family transcriptional regulator